MNKVLLIFISSLFILQITGCNNGKGNSQKAIASIDSSSAKVDYLALQEKAMKFVPETGKFGGQIVLSTVSDPKSFNPITSTETSTSEFTQYMYEGLIRINGVTLMPEANISDKWEVSGDGLIFTFHIRDNVLWSDSTRFSAYDVEFTFNDLIYNKAITPNSSRDIFTMEGKKIAVKALDSSHVEFRLPFTYAPFLRVLSQEILPKHKYSALVKKGSFSTSLGIQTPPDQMVGTGPFMLESYISSQKVIFKRNPLYWKTDSQGNKLPYLDKIVYTVVTDQNAELLQFKRGEVDYLTAKGEDFPGLKKDEPTSNYSVFRLGPASGSNFLFFNMNNRADPKSKKPYVDSIKLSWFTNTKFRQAIAYALDKDNMINIVMNGLGYPQWSPMAPSEGYFFNSKVTEYPYNIEKAKQILAAEGFIDTNGDGIIEDKGGNPVEFSFVTNSGNNTRVKIAEIIRKDIESLGIKVHFQQIEFNSLIQKIDHPPYEWEAILLGLTGGPEPHSGRNVWHSSGTLHMWSPVQTSAATPWEASIDSIYDAGVKELDTLKRKVLYDRWQQIVSDEVPLIYTVLPEKILCIANKFGNLNPSLNGGLLHNLEYIYVK